MTCRNPNSLILMASTQRFDLPFLYHLGVVLGAISSSDPTTLESPLSISALSSSRNLRGKGFNVGIIGRGNFRLAMSGNGFAFSSIYLFHVLAPPAESLENSNAPAFDLILHISRNSVFQRRVFGSSTSCLGKTCTHTRNLYSSLGLQAYNVV